MKYKEDNEEKKMSDKMNKELNEAEINQIIDEEIGAYLEENAVGAGAVAGYAVKEEEVDEARRGVDQKAHKFTKGSRDSYTDKFGRKIPYRIDGCDLELKDIPSTYPQGHPVYDGKPVDPETGMPVEAITVHGMMNRHKLHKWMCANPKSKPIPITAKAPNDEFQGTVGSGAPFPRGPGAKPVFKEGISLRVATPDTLDEI